MAYQPAAGTNYGAKQYDRVKHITKIFSVVATLLAAIFYLPIMIAPKTMLSLFIVEPEIVAQGANDFRLFFSSYIVLGFFSAVKNVALSTAVTAAFNYLEKDPEANIPKAVKLINTALPEGWYEGRRAAFRKAIEEKSYAACWSGTADKLWSKGQKSAQ